ncbi:High affinity Ca2+/Mn2+ P-type ATPase-like protein [Irineochytrium annulatum]|nr:High affinity Ca2+/Mn2+ P-type ATPase-like protein [Irineochytrium annulatum]
MDTREYPPNRNYDASHVDRNPTALYATKSVDETAIEQNSDARNGIDGHEAEFRRKLVGTNELTSDDEETLLSKFVDQFKNPLILLLFGSALISLVLGQIDDAVSITLAIIIVVTVAFVQEYRSEKSLQALNQLVPHNCNVIRRGNLSTIPATELVPGDLVQFRTGDRIPADIRLVTAIDLEVDESSLTGETKPCKKNNNKIGSLVADLPLADRKNIVFMGTLVRNGHGTGIVVGTGKNTEFGFVFKMMKDVEVRKTPLQTNMDLLGKHLSMLSFGVIIVIVIIGVFQGRQLLEMFTIGVSLAVAAIPEGLPIVVTVTLALGVLRMAKRHAIIKKLPSVESLGSVNVICVDKTGTLTMNKMTVAKVFTLGHNAIIDVESLHTYMNSAISNLIRIGVLCNNAHVDDSNQAVGQPTEIALLEFAKRFGFEDERMALQRVSEVSFTSESKYMAVLVELPDTKDKLYFVKGSLESMLDRCSHFFVAEDDVRTLDAALKETDLNALTFVGFVAMYDPPRPGIRDAIGRLLSGGVRVVMITGDSDGTAESIAQQLGIPFNMNARSKLSGADVDYLTESQLEDVIDGITIFYRTTPKHKMSIVRAFQAKGSIVAMTGDGVNDAPALRLADIGISMGKSGTDVSKEASDMILVNDDFSLTLIALATLFGLPNPLNAMQILWISKFLLKQYGALTGRDSMDLLE